MGTFSRLNDIEGESNAESGGTKLPEVGDSSDGWLTEPGIEDEASFFAFFDHSDFGCNRGGLRYKVSGGNVGAVINDDVGAEATTDAETEEEEGKTSPVLFHSHGFGAFVLDLDLDLGGVGFGDGCCLRDLVSAPRA